MCINIALKCVLFSVLLLPIGSSFGKSISEEDYQDEYDNNIITRIVPEEEGNLYEVPLFAKEYDDEYMKINAILLDDRKSFLQSIWFKILIIVVIAAIIGLFVWICWAPLLALCMNYCPCLDIASRGLDFLKLSPPGVYVDKRKKVHKYESTEDELFYYEQLKQELVRPL